jgi:hypothetical protein
MTKLILILLLTLAPLSYASAPINYASGIDPASFEKLHPKLKDIAYFVASFCQQNGIKFVITSTIRTKERNRLVGGKSETHTSGRAFDFSLREEYGWTDDRIMLLVYQIERNYKEFGAYSLNGGKQVVIFNHSAESGKGGLYHSHIQVRRDLPWN